ncbi:hypothetical protein LA20249_03165 [Companilactobacillus alimentarius DSM 20249]|uniref:Uncharacterized protein n=1 Tax=Companilactobacillus alimentarius DSM 20249 TaxID=1423720 RepID=A0A2K9HHJ3_9LACO|nr:hypothetical protein LA20249_03165 [Companilactobacillus alimentarius DSM 20249]
MAFSKNESGVIIFLGFKWMFELFLDFFLLEINVFVEILRNLPVPSAIFEQLAIKKEKGYLKILHTQSNSG